MMLETALFLSVCVNTILIAWNVAAHLRHRSCRAALTRVRGERDELRAKVWSMMESESAL